MPLGAFKAALMGTAGVSTETVVLLASSTGSGVSEIEFTSGITSTYGEYIFRFYNINPATDAATFGFQVDGVGESGYNETITSTFFRAYKHESGYTPAVAYYAGFDLAQGTAQQPLTETQGSDSDESVAGELHLFNPASTTYVKHFIGRTQHVHPHPVAVDAFTAGYINTTTAIDSIKFYMDSGDFDGTIKMWGVK